MAIIQMQILALALALLGSAFSQESRPNFIVMQPDDMEFFEAWMPPAHVTNNGVFAFPASGLPNLERLRQGSVQMTQAYAATSSCAPSRFSTLTGRYASRSGVLRTLNANEDVVEVNVANTRLDDTSTSPNDCDNNMAALLQKNGYRTGVVGKWHLSDVPRNAAFSYPDFQERVRQCGFDAAEAMNVGGAWRDDSYSHNLEYLAEKAIEFISASEDAFFLYVNPTAPHEQASVLEGLTAFECTDTSAGKLDSEPQVPGMTAGTTCAAYRQTIIDRAAGATDNNSLGAIWIDDVVGSILQVLEARNQLDNTFFLFHLDHGQEGKGSLFEQGLRIPKFLHFPKAFPVGKMFDGLISTIDTAPTILDYAGVTKDSSGYYEMDGRSWRNAVETGTSDGDRCIYFELDQDRAMRCGCHKYLYIYDASASSSMRRAARFGMASTSEDGGELLFNLCDQDGAYESTVNKEATDVASSSASELIKLSELSSCLLDKTFPTSLKDFEDCGLNPAPAPPVVITCFPGDAQVQIKKASHEELVQMKDLRLGDKVLAGNGKYEPIYSFGHYDQNIETQYTTLITTSGRSIALSKDHMVYIHGGRAVPASTIKVGDQLESTGEFIRRIKLTIKQGAFAPFTLSGTVIVNGIKASSFIAYQESETLIIGTFDTGLSFQFLAQTYLTPRRLWCQYVASCTVEQYTDEGISNWVVVPHTMVTWLFAQNTFINHAIRFASDWISRDSMASALLLFVAAIMALRYAATHVMPGSSSIRIKYA